MVLGTPLAIPSLKQHKLAIKGENVKLLIILVSFSCIFYQTANADTRLEAMSGALVYHPTDMPSQSQSYPNQVAPGLISPTIYGARIDLHEDTVYTAYSLFGGENSYAHQMLGGSFSVGVPFTYLELGMVVGAYIRSLNPNFVDSNQEPTTVPMMGIEANLRFPFTESVALKVNSLLSMQLVTALASLEFRI